MSNPTPEEIAAARAIVEAEDQRLRVEAEQARAAEAAVRAANIAQLKEITDGPEFDAVLSQIKALVPLFVLDAHVTTVPACMQGLRDWVARYAA